MLTEASHNQASHFAWNLQHFYKDYWTMRPEELQERTVTVTNKLKLG